MYYGWKIVAVAFVTNFVSVGFLFYSYGVLFKAIAADFGGSRFGVALGLVTVQIVTAVFAPRLGRALDRRPIRLIMCVGATLMSVGFFLASRISELYQFYLVLATLIGLGSAMLGGLPGSTLVANWFVKRRGTALGIAATGISASGFAMAPIATWLIDQVGWRGTFVAYGFIALLGVVPLVWLAVINRPEDLQLSPDGSPTPARDDDHTAAEAVLPLAPGDLVTDHPAAVGGSVPSALRDRNFWVIALAISLNFCPMSAVLTHIVPHVTDIGFGAQPAALVLSAIAGCGVLGKLLFGWTADRIDKRIGLWTCSVLMCVGVSVFIQTRDYSALLIGGAIFGLGMGGVVPIHGALLGAAFGRERFGRVMGAMHLRMLPVQVVGVPLAGYVFDRGGSYDLAFEIFLGLYACSMVAAAFLRLPQVEPLDGQTLVVRRR